MTAATQVNPAQSQATLEELVRAAIRAPSGDNTQPWLFELDDEQNRLLVAVDEERDRSPMNAGQRMSRIAVGAAVENVVRLAEANGLKPVCEATTNGLRITVSLNAVSGEMTPDEVIFRRTTNRRMYDRRPISPEVANELANRTSAFQGVSTHWILDREKIRGLASLISRADDIMFGNPVIRSAFLDNVRYDADDCEEVEYGLSLGSLEVRGLERTAFRMLPRLPTWLLQLGRIGRTFARKTRKMVLSSSGLCLGVARDDEPSTDLTVGRAMQRAWLALTEHGLAAQPMMSLLVLQNALTHGSAALRHSLKLARVEELLDEFSAVRPTSGRPAFLLRCGYAQPPSGRCGRCAPRPAQVTKRDY